MAQVLREFRYNKGTVITRHEDAAREEVKATILSLVTAGEVVPDDVSQPVLDARRLDELASLRLQALGNLARQESDSEASILAQGRDKGFAFLREELSRLIAEVRKLAPTLSSVRSADEAIGHGEEATAAWRRLTELVSEYDEIRTLQFELSKEAVVTRDRFLEGGILADAIDTLDRWVDRRRTSFSRRAEGGGFSNTSLGTAGAAYRAWLVEGLPAEGIQYTTGWWPKDESRPLHLLHIATNAKPWLPTADELMEALDLANTATGYVSEDRPAGQEQARAAYYQLTGAKPRTALPEPSKVVRSGFPSQTQQADFQRKLRGAAARDGHRR